VSILACLSLLSGIVLGLRFNVRLLLLVCLGVIATAVAAPLAAPVSLTAAALCAGVAILALQVGYFVAVVIGAMQLTEEPEPSPARESIGRELPRGPAEARRR
jgi:hypothetical protein